MVKLKKDLDVIIDDVFKVKHGKIDLNDFLDKEEFRKKYYKIIKHMKKPSGYYKMDRIEYQKCMNIWLYRSRENNIYCLLALAMIDTKLFDGVD